MLVSQLAPNVVHDVWPWAALLLLGALHGINPGMGWLFAVALGVQRRERRAVWRALLPLAAGHAAAIVVVAVVVGMIGTTVSLGHLRWVVTAFLLALGVSKLVRDRHPRWGGMTVGSKDVAVWSFLMASAHGAGLMVVPFLLRVVRPVANGVPQAHMHHMAASGMTGSVSAGGLTNAHAGHAAAVLAGVPAIPSAGLAVALVHTAGYLLVTGVVAVVVYERLGLRLLGRAWFNVDRLWAGALIATAVLTPLLA